MPHLRNRQIKPALLKKLKLWPSVCLLGPRQCGKSTLLRELLFNVGCSSYVTLDRSRDRSFATANPQAFLAQFEKLPLIIDEAQKAPPIFDEIKAEVDLNRRPGSYILSGSVQFSKKVGIRESLLGRTAIVMMDSLTLQETLEKKVPKLSDTLRFLKKGGMPGIFSLRNQEEIKSYWEEWVATLCDRDLKTFSKGKLSGDLAFQVLEKLALLEVPTAHLIGQKLGQDTRRVTSHLDALVDLFVVRRISPHIKSEMGKDQFTLFDPGLVDHFNGPLEKRWEAWFLLEFMNSAAGVSRPRMNYFKTREGQYSPFVTKQAVHFYTLDPAPSRGLLLKAAAAQKHFDDLTIFIHTQAEGPVFIGKKSLQIVPWTGLNSLKSRL